MKLLTEDWFWAAVQAGGLLTTLVLILRQIRLQTATHAVQTLEAIHHRWSEDSMLRARHAVCERYLRDEHCFDSIGQFITEYMEELGVYLKLKAVTPDTMWDAYSWYIEHYYSMFKSDISTERIETQEQHLYENFESLFLSLKLISQKKGAPDSNRTPLELRQFAEDEVRRTAAFLLLQATKVQST